MIMRSEKDECCDLNFCRTVGTASCIINLEELVLFKRLVA